VQKISVLKFAFGMTHGMSKTNDVGEYSANFEESISSVMTLWRASPARDDSFSLSINKTKLVAARSTIKREVKDLHRANKEERTKEIKIQDDMKPRF
jgi:hypothetical protein